MSDLPTEDGSSAPAWPDAAMIAQWTNAFFQAPPNQAVTAPTGLGIPLVPPSPAFVPTPGNPALAASIVPFRPPIGPPDVPSTTIPSVVPTPNLTIPQMSSVFAPQGSSTIPQPGASPGSFGPTNFDATLIDPGKLSGFAPDHFAVPFDGAGTQAGVAPPATDTFYFLSDAPLARNVSAAGNPAQPVDFASARPPSVPDTSGPATPYSAASISPATSADLAIPVLDLRPELVPNLGLTQRPFDPLFVRRDFPILQERVNGRPLVWLDNAATTQKPQAVIDRLAHFYAHENSNIHRAAHTLAARATDAYEAAREKVCRFLRAGSPREIIFVRGATEGINLVAQSWGRRNVKRDDEIVITWLEHHANIVPWQQLCVETGARLRVAPVDESGQVIQEEYERLLNPKTRIVAIAHVSNALGTIVPVAEMTAAAHRHGACVLVDGAQSVSHMPVDVQAIDCDFYVLSGHKVFGPTGIGVVYGKPAVLSAMPPWQGGGNMIADVTFEKTVYQAAPERFEAGTGNIADAAGLGAAIDYVEAIGMDVIARYEHELLVYATERMLTIPGLKLIGTAREKASVLSFVLDGHRSEDVGKALDKEGIAVRAGHHCAQPILRRFGLESTVRPSLAFYNTHEEIDLLVSALKRLQAGVPARAFQ
jgi:cysteine desulfurase/selenocysteine lyase